MTLRVHVEYNGDEGLDEQSKYGLGVYECIGGMQDGSAVYIQSKADHAKHYFDGRSVILIDSQGGNNWIGTVILFTQFCTMIIYHFRTACLNKYTNNFQINAKEYGIKQSFI